MTLPEAFVKTVDHFVPTFWSALSQVPDHRDPTRIVYPIEEELLVGILMFMVKLGCRRNIKYKLNTPAFVNNIQRIGKEVYANIPFPDALFHGDTLNYLLKGIEPDAIHQLRKLVIHRLLRKRCLEDGRLLGLYYTIAVDGTGHLAFAARHCEHCLKRTIQGVTFYLHQALEAKLVLPEMGMALSVGTEFIENEREDVSKQDCELKAFYRLARRLKGDFSQLSICLLMDSLYAAKPVMELCERNRWHFLVTFKEGSAPAVFEDYEALLKLAPDSKIKDEDRETAAGQTYRWVNRVDWNGQPVHVLENLETTRQGKKRFVWVSSIEVNADNVRKLAQKGEGGRCRWMIENGFNIQKNGGYGLEHAFSESDWAMKNFYLLMQIGHIFNQLMEKGSLLRERIETEMGSLKVFSERLWACLTEVWIDPCRLRAILKQPIQIRFDTS